MYQCTCAIWRGYRERGDEVGCHNFEKILMLCPYLSEFHLYIAWLLSHVVTANKSRILLAREQVVTASYCWLESEFADVRANGACH